MSETVNTAYGELAGVDCGDYMVYKSVPYAQPPLGELRWRAPQPPEPWEGVLEATQFHGRCMQDDPAGPPWDKDFYDNPSYITPATEDCLYLHIWAPKDAHDAPVALWIHGGAFMGGYAFEKEFDGAAYCAHGIIMVSVEYRCNVFGYLAHPWLTAEAGTSGNYGTLDQIAALRWVHENIASFGGDPANITVFGQSAGAMSVQTLCSSPLARPYITKAILQSGGSYGSGLHRDMPLAEQEHYGQMFAEVAGVKSLDEMRALSANRVLTLIPQFFEKAMPEAHGLFLTPTIDGRVLTGGYYELMDAGEIADIPYLIGCTKDDILTTPEMDKPAEDPLYQGCIAFSRKLDELGRKPAYMYYFTRDLPGDDLGAWHSSELWYTMGTLDRCWRPWTEGDRKLEQRILDYWANFMRDGDPNGEGLPTWAPCDCEKSFVMELNV